MANIRCSINIDTEEVAGYTGLLGAILNQAVKDLQKSYCKLIKTRTEYSYNEFKNATDEELEDWKNGKIDLYNREIVAEFYVINEIESNLLEKVMNDVK